jgi:hypothetical protein
MSAIVEHFQCTCKRVVHSKLDIYPFFFIIEVNKHTFCEDNIK